MPADIPKDQSSHCSQKATQGTKLKIKSPFAFKKLLKVKGNFKDQSPLHARIKWLKV
jgi:hypothetical protein